MSFVERKIGVAIKLAQTGTNQPNRFVESGSDTVTLEGSRTSVRIQNSGGLSGSEANVSIWGLTPSLMNQLSTLGKVIQLIPRNTITISAGDAEVGMSTVFIGTILQAYGDYNAAPKVPFTFVCNAGAAEDAIPFPVSSYTGATAVSDVLSAIAGRQTPQWGFENNGVTAQISNPYLSGTAMAQVRRICQQAGINWTLTNNVLAIWPLYGNRATPAGIPLLSKDTGMVGYPSFTQQGIMVKTVFDQRIVFGGQIKVQSSIFTTLALSKGVGLDNPTSTWNVLKLDHALDALVPGGEWMSTIYAYNPRYPSPLPPQTGGTA